MYISQQQQTEKKFSQYKKTLLPIEVLHYGNRNVDVFGSCDLDLDPMTFTYELDP